jgi:hypothetical protein
MHDPPLHVADGTSGVALIPAPVELFRHRTELDDQVVGKILGFDLTALLPPQPNEIGFVVTHDYPGI